MRQILFRGKRIDNGEWIEGLLIKLRIERNHEYQWIDAIQKFEENNGTYYSYFTYKIISETVSQYTGLTDKNGKKIFEGEIVYWGSKRSYGTRGNYEVIFQPKKCGFGLKMIEHPYQVYGMQAGKQLEVIGNIHDNPELLESE